MYHALVVIFLEFFAWGLLTTPMITEGVKSIIPKLVPKTVTDVAPDGWTLKATPIDSTGANGKE